MKTSIRKNVIVAFLGIMLGASQAGALTMLPDPSIPVDPSVPAYGTLGTMYGDFLAYSLDLNNQVLNTTAYNVQVQTLRDPGVVIYTQANGATNKADLGGAFPVPLYSTGSSFTGMWLTGPNQNGAHADTVTVNVSDVLALLHTVDATLNTPLFVFDMAQPQTGYDYLTLQGSVVISGIDGTKTYYFNNEPVSPGAVIVPAKLPLGVYTIDNTGRGYADYVSYIPGLDLTKFNPNDTFTVNFSINNQGSAGQELLMGAFYAPYNSVPEPGTLALVGLGMLGLAIYGKRHMGKQS